MGFVAEVGRAVLSKAGRDRGRTFVITNIEDDRYVSIADGTLRKVGKPKRKKLMHLRLLPYKADAIAAELDAGKQVMDSDVRKYLATITACMNASVEEDF